MITLLDLFGDERTIVNAARVSFGVHKDHLDEKDIKLLQYLHKHQHTSPFRHVMFRFKIKAPEFVMRQWYKHVVGIETTSSSCTKDHAWSEISGRYIPVTEFYAPEKWRKQSVQSKQGSNGFISNQDQLECEKAYRDCMEKIIKTYQFLLDKGVAKEQARIMLPLNQYTQVIWTCSVQALHHFILLRNAPHAQKEIRDYAEQLKVILKNKLPILHDILFSHSLK